MCMNEKFLKQEIFLLTGPITDGKYCPEIEKCLIRAAKRKILEDLEGESIIGYGKNI